MPDFRKHIRVNIMIPCGIKIANLHPDDAWGHIEDISLGGVLFRTYFSIVKGQKLFLTFSIDAQYEFTHAQGTALRVRQANGYSIVGFSFDNLIDKDHLREALQSLLEKI